MSDSIQTGTIMPNDKLPPITRRVEKNHFLRDTLVYLRIPQRLPRDNLSLRPIAEKIAMHFKIKQPKVSALDYESALKEALRLGLLEHKEKEQVLCLTQQAVEIFEQLDIAKCECGAFLVRRREDGTRPSSMYCWNCSKVIWNQSS